MDLVSQAYVNHDYLGAGHEYGVFVSSSSGSGNQTVNGFPIQNQEQLSEASRFLAQCTFGADMATIQMVSAMGKEAWLEEQFSLPATFTTDKTYEFFQDYDNEKQEGTPEVWISWFESSWFHNNMTAADILRQRMANIMSQIFVIGATSDLFFDYSHLTATYYDSLLINSFGNYRKLIDDITYSPAMGRYLSHYSNQKANPELNTNPDENYAREIMQLFSIGLWELEQNGSRKKDESGAFISTYNNDDIKQFAKVFTGLSDGSSKREFGGVHFLSHYDNSYSLPMVMYEDYHDSGEKHLLNGYKLPANQTGDIDVSMTLDHLSSHQNTAPFICKALIQFMTTSNPSYGYVQRIARKFDPYKENNFQKIIKAILLDPEASSCNPTSDRRFGKLKEPVVRMMNFLRAMPLTADGADNYVNDMECVMAQMGQSPLKSPSVFNFFRPDYRPSSSVEWNYLVGPEYQLLNSSNAIGLINDVDRTAIRGEYLNTCLWEEIEQEVAVGEAEFFEESNFMDRSAVLAISDSEMIRYLNILYAHGQLSSDTQAIIQNALNQLDESEDKLRMAMYLILISPDYAILK